MVLKFPSFTDEETEATVGAEIGTEMAEGAEVGTEIPEDAEIPEGVEASTSVKTFLIIDSHNSND